MAAPDFKGRHYYPKPHISLVLRERKRDIAVRIIHINQRFTSLLLVVFFAISLILFGCGGKPASEASSQSSSELPVTAPGKAPAGMAWIPGGQFLMGDDGEYAAADERPIHAVRVDGFFMDTHTVTNVKFAEFVKATGYVTVAERAPNAEELLKQLPPGTPPPDPTMLVPGSLVFTPTTHAVNLNDWSQWWKWTPGADWRHPEGPQSSLAGMDDFPVVQLAWEDAVAYAAWAGRRLPTEAEWEFAARGGRERVAHTWGDAAYDDAKPQANIYQGTFPTHAARPGKVGSYPPATYGLYDMTGNVWQWTMDWYRPDTYQKDRDRGVVSNPTGPDAGLDPRTEGQPSKVARGGSFLCHDSYCRGYRVSARSPGAPDSGASHIGFRTVMTVEQWEQRQAKGAQE